jgi:hypothetical protein
MSATPPMAGVSMSVIMFLSWILTSV